MMRRLAFEKWQALGNDFVLIDSRQLVQAFKPDKSQILAMADRHRGIGFDQLLLITEGKATKVEVNIYNADGSSAAQCGNGLRCVARYVSEQLSEPHDAVNIEVAGRQFSAQLLDDKQVKIDFGQAEYVARRSFFESHYDLISLGNQHAVVFLDYLPDARDEKRAEMIQASLPDSINVALCHYQTPETIICRVVERGAGLTLACGSGAAAAVAAARQHYPIAASVVVQQPGGKLTIECDERLNLLQTGEAQRVFSGNYFFNS